MASDLAVKYFERGLALFHKGEHEKAADLFYHAVVESPEYWEALYNLAGCHATLGNLDDALVYLVRAAQLNGQCLQWAREDYEFDTLRDDDRFIRALEGVNGPAFSADPPEGEIPTGEADSSREESAIPDEGTEGGGSGADPMPNLDDGGRSPRFEHPESELPPCPGCGGIVECENGLRYPLWGCMAVVAAGVGVTIFWFSWLGTFTGIPMILAGFYGLMQTRPEYVCQNCGARGYGAGQPPDAPRPAG